MDKLSSTALVRRILAGRLSPATVQRAAAAMPDGSFRTLGHLGQGQFNLADKVVGNVGGHAGVMARKLPIRRFDGYVEEGQRLKQITDRFNAEHAPVSTLETVAQRLNPIRRTPIHSDPPIAPIVASTPKGLFQQLSTGKPIHTADTERKLRRTFYDLHDGNKGPFGQYHDAQPIQGVPELFEMGRRPSLWSRRITGQLPKSLDTDAINAVRRMYSNESLAKPYNLRAINTRQRYVNATLPAEMRSIEAMRQQSFRKAVQRNAAHSTPASPVRMINQQTTLAAY